MEFILTIIKEITIFDIFNAIFISLVLGTIINMRREIFNISKKDNGQRYLYIIYLYDNKDSYIKCFSNLLYTPEYIVQYNMKEVIKMAESSNIEMSDEFDTCVEVVDRRENEC